MIVNYFSESFGWRVSENKNKLKTNKSTKMQQHKTTYEFLSGPLNKTKKLKEKNQSFKLFL